MVQSNHNGVLNNRLGSINLVLIVYCARDASKLNLSSETITLC